jgi:hypothetical protein
VSFYLFIYAVRTTPRGMPALASWIVWFWIAAHGLSFRGESCKQDDGLRADDPIRMLRYQKGKDERMKGRRLWIGS